MYITLTRKKLFLMLCLAIAVLLVLLQVVSVKAEKIDVSTNAKRVEYIKSLGVTLSSEDSTDKQIVIPQKFNDVYEKYNELQQEAGFDLTDFKGKNVTVYTYSCAGERVVNLMVYNGKLIGGDIAETLLGGSMKALKE